MIFTNKRGPGRVQGQVGTQKSAKKHPNKGRFSQNSRKKSASPPEKDPTFQEMRHISTSISPEKSKKRQKKMAKGPQGRQAKFCSHEVFNGVDPLKKILLFLDRIWTPNRYFSASAHPKKLGPNVRAYLSKNFILLPVAPQKSGFYVSCPLSEAVWGVIGPKSHKSLPTRLPVFGVISLEPLDFCPKRRVPGGSRRILV